MAILKLKIQGMNCAGCASKIETKIAALHTVSSSSVNFATEMGKFELVSNKKSAKDQVKAKLKELGYQYSEDRHAQSKVASPYENLRLFYISMSLTIGLFALSMWPLMGWPNVKTNWLLQLLLAAPIWGYIGLHFQKSVYNFIKTGNSDMNTLIGVGTSAAFLYSAFITVFQQTSIHLGLTQQVYFEAVGFIVSFVYLGKYFEERAKKKTKSALNALFQLNVKRALLVVGGDTQSIAIEEVKQGDTLRVKPGEKVPVDGVIVKGESTIDESMISGESMPKHKLKSHKVFSGTINGEGAIDIQATKVGEGTLLSQIVNYVEEAQSAKPEIQRYADKISAIFTPVILILSVCTFLIWFLLGPEPIWGNALSNFIAVLVIACPCALGLATPTAVVVATGKASLRGLLISGGDVLENATDINAIVFDKTGTITEGRSTVVEYKCTDENIESQELLNDIASIEQYSEHPLSRAVVQYAKASGAVSFTEPQDFKIIQGQGVQANLNTDRYLMGNLRLMKENSISLDRAQLLDPLATPIFVAKNGILVGYLLVTDPIKASSKSVIEQLQKQNIKTWMITGDHKSIAEHVGNQLGIDHVFSGALPLDKANYIQDIQNKGYKVAMVGDGVNDAPALAKADLSIAMGTGSDVAMNASDVTLVHGDLAKALDFLNLSQGTMRIIKQNLFLSLIYNISLIPVAAGALYLFGGPLLPPALASAAMALSSVSVVTNSLRIRKLID
ncbi:MAG: cadmium-translocating P-type ATPase [Bdellovibrionaceae bacterium]|jgi:P-type Cu+ transporter|nr:cadmium-translocating P-type ATPase [Pseudobdellovibrionaceae bacterium]